LFSSSLFAFNLAYEKYYNEKDSIQRELILKESNAYNKTIIIDDGKSSCEKIAEQSIVKHMNKLDEMIYDISIEASVIVSKKLNNSLPLVIFNSFD
jgi:hypothetical protein